MKVILLLSSLTIYLSNRIDALRININIYDLLITEIDLIDII